MGNENKIELFPLIVIATAGIIILALFIILFIFRHQKKMIAHSLYINEKESNHQKELLNASLEIAEQERLKIARNVHDDIGMMLHALKLNISKAKRNLKDIKIVEEQLDETDKIIESTITATRFLSYELMPPPLINIGFIEGMHYLIKQVASAKLIEIELKTELEHIDFDAKNAIHLYRLIKEVLNNIIKHTKATRTEVNIYSNENVLNVIIAHNGKGVTTETVYHLTESSKGVGLKSIMGRAQLINATVQYIIVEENKAKIIIEIPLI